MILGGGGEWTVNNDGLVMSQFFPQGLGVNAYIATLEDVAQQMLQSPGSAPSPTTFATLERLAENFHDHVDSNRWPPNAQDLNPLDCYTWGVVETG